MSRRAKRLRLTYRSLEEDPSYEHQVDRLVRLRVRGRALERTAAQASHEIVKALGDKKRLWFSYERAADTLRARREAAYFDAGVELGTAAVAMGELRSRRRGARELGWRLTREAMTAGAAREDALAAVVMTAWGLIAAANGGRQRSGATD